MARKIDPAELARHKSRAKAQRDGEADLAVLFPDATVTVGGEEITVREYRFKEGMRAAPLWQPLVDSLFEAFRGKSASITAMRQAYAAHPDEVAALIALSCNRSVEWLEALSDADRETLLLTWLTVTMDFFVRRVAAEFHSRKAMADALAGAIFSQPSSPTDTTRNGSANTRTVN